MRISKLIAVLFLTAPSVIVAVKPLEKVKLEPTEAPTFRQTRVPNVLIAYYSETNHTRELAEIIARGALKAQTTLVESGLYHGASSSGEHVRAVPISAVDFTRDVVQWADAVLLGSPTHYGNPAAALLQRIESTWDWSVDLSSKIGGVFATGGGIHDGTESVLQALARTLMAFRAVHVGNDCSRGGQYSTFGASAVTATPPFGGSGRAGGAAGKGLIDEEFVAPAEAFGARVVNITARYIS